MSGSARLWSRVLFLPLPQLDESVSYLSMQGKLLNEIIEATGLPTESLREDMKRLFEGLGVDTTTDDIELIRKALAVYLCEVMAEVKKEAGPL